MPSEIVANCRAPNFPMQHERQFSARVGWERQIGRRGGRRSEPGKEHEGTDVEFKLLQVLRTLAQDILECLFEAFSEGLNRKLSIPTD